MTLFFSASTLGFYDDQVHGPRLVKILDPDWVRPVKKIPDPYWVRPTLEVPDESAVAPTIEIDGALLSDPEWARPTVSAEDEDAIHPTITVNDEEADHPLVEVENLDCLLPIDAREISASEHLALLDEQRTGKVITADGDGNPTAVDAPAPSDAELWIVVRRTRDALIDAVAWRYERNAREQRLGIALTDNLEALDVYIQALADLTGHPDPTAIEWPVLTI